VTEHQPQQTPSRPFLATASPAKWDFLKAQGIKTVMNSRSLEFKDQVLEATGGRGVDVVLNSLTGDYIQASFDVLTAGGWLNASPVRQAIAYGQSTCRETRAWSPPGLLRARATGG